MEKKLNPDSPSPLEEEFQHEFTELIDQYKKDFLTHGWSAEELAKWCKEMVNKELCESEDETHRKWILEYLYDGLRKADEQFKDHFKSAIDWLEKQKEQKHPNGCFTCDEYKKGYEEGRRNGFTAGYNKAMKEVEQKEQKPSWKPSEEQIYSLGTIVKGVGEASVGSIGYNLKELYEHLKKL